MATAEREHRHSAVPYVAVWIVLLVLTIVTFVTGKMHLGTWALPLAMLIATTKAALVAIIFMHLSESGGTTRLVFVTSLVFVALLMSFALADTLTRFVPATPKGAPFGTENRQPEGLLEHELPE